jgi:hypothetical protein
MLTNEIKDVSDGARRPAGRDPANCNAPPLALFEEALVCFISHVLTSLTSRRTVTIASPQVREAAYGENFKSQSPCPPKG